MFRKSYWKKRFAPVLAGALVISSLLVPPGHAFAADPVTSEEQTVSPETPDFLRRNSEATHIPEQLPTLLFSTR